MRTEEGDITLRIYLDKAPISGENFMRYVDSGALNNQTLFRIVTPDNEEQARDHYIQALHWGWRAKDANDPRPFPQIPLERTRDTGLRHVRGTLAMGRYEPGNSGSEFFIMMNEDPEMDFGGKRQPDGQGFAAFGQVESGWDVMDRLYARAEKDQTHLRQPIAISEVARVD
ncbi:peptidyl-prolyl cis-trans isomerase A (cyclophilin A) [Ketogulonicigenium robustum]|uniref:peptidylprolyl isomerase n=2 Tax=Ketogulonicigenium robustum TaxID=92947 RepID=A0A1W6P0E8_9RHOB|nr:peptidyl-prolyl cis-trans isomerase A (cyclophilin A) [Ketogulonicigenium robustum]